MSTSLRKANTRTPPRKGSVCSTPASTSLVGIGAESAPALASIAGGTVLPGAYFASADTVAIARELIGCKLCRRLEDGSIARWVLTQTEAYDGPQDKACHAHKGRTGRTEVLFGRAGHCYVYLCYGVHWLLNIVTGPVDYPAAVLIRGAGAVMGPGRLTRALEIDKTLNTQPLGGASGIWVEAPAEPVDPSRVVAAARIGVAYAGEDWANRPYRFTLH